MHRASCHITAQTKALISYLETADLCAQSTFILLDSVLLPSRLCIVFFRAATAEACRHSVVTTIDEGCNLQPVIYRKNAHGTLSRRFVARNSLQQFRSGCKTRTVSDFQVERHHGGGHASGYGPGRCQCPFARCFNDPITSGLQREVIDGDQREQSLLLSLLCSCMLYFLHYGGPCRTTVWKK